MIHNLAVCDVVCRGKTLTIDVSSHKDDMPPVRHIAFDFGGYVDVGLHRSSRSGRVFIMLLRNIQQHPR